MKKSSSLVAAALQLLACASLIPNSGSAKVATTDSSQATISERIARVRTAMVEQTKPVTDEGSIHLTGWGNWHNGWRNWGNGWRKWGNGWRKWGNY
ncbi:MAG: rSAM-associated Gly-rich repeat protein [Verrucomicrobia bacterium]|nr:rSAM-associated Gly-rich repeat protein [Verrucomicrobiota bacterium]